MGLRPASRAESRSEILNGLSRHMSVLAGSPMRDPDWQNSLAAEERLRLGLEKTLSPEVCLTSKTKNKELFSFS